MAMIIVLDISCIFHRVEFIDLPVPSSSSPNASPMDVEELTAFPEGVKPLNRKIYHFNEAGAIPWTRSLLKRMTEHGCLDILVPLKMGGFLRRLGTASTYSIERVEVYLRRSHESGAKISEGVIVDQFPVLFRHRYRASEAPQLTPCFTILRASIGTNGGNFKHDLVGVESTDRDEQNSNDGRGDDKGWTPNLVAQEVSNVVEERDDDCSSSEASLADGDVNDGESDSGESNVFLGGELSEADSRDDESESSEDSGAKGNQDEDEDGNGNSEFEESEEHCEEKVGRRPGRETMTRQRTK
ncbi:unnamed protein product [Phytophthora fragariaefolia]|uniref:Unnamed protein product n=1 Tax=Phytophthora fragariaefolia TaxID=1490495 RepID=A0A9W6XHY3_9STRA|nr:unnamed protein product [Phytophthora fragariaefolia]